MNVMNCPNCQSVASSDMPFCKRCGAPLTKSLNSGAIERFLSRATNREWVAISKAGDNRIILMEKHPHAFMSYSCSSSGSSSFWALSRYGYNKETDCDLIVNWDWEHSLVRDYLNGPYLSTLPEWAISRLVTIDVVEEGKHLLDKATILSEEEIDLFLAGAPRIPNALEILEVFKSIQKSREQKSEDLFESDYDEYEDYDASWDYDYEPDDPLSRWENDSRQYSKEGYDEWMDDYYSVLEAQKDWLWWKSWEDEADYQKYREEEEEKERQKRARWCATLCDAGCEWTREGHESRAYRDTYYYEIGAVAAIRPVICLNIGEASRCNEDSISISKTTRLSPMLNDAELDELIAFASESETASDHGETESDEADRILAENAQSENSSIVGDGSDGEFDASVFDEDVPF